MAQAHHAVLQVCIAPQERLLWVTCIAATSRCGLLSGTGVKVSSTWECKEDARALLLAARTTAEACEQAVAEGVEGLRELSEKEAAEAAYQVFANSLTAAQWWESCGSLSCCAGRMPACCCSQQAQQPKHASRQ